MPSCSWPGIVQMNWYDPAFRLFTVAESLPPGSALRSRPSDAIVNVCGDVLEPFRNTNCTGSPDCTEIVDGWYSKSTPVTCTDCAPGFGFGAGTVATFPCPTMACITEIVEPG